MGTIFLMHFVCECGYDHPHKAINGRDWRKLKKFPEYSKPNAFIVRENCKYREAGEVIVARSGELVLVLAPEENYQ